MIKLSDYVIEFLENKGVRHVFLLPGGGAMHLVDSVGKSNMEYICCQHEQAASIAAESYGQHTNNVGVCLTTSGPGASNAITGVTAGWIDSTPMFVISGQAKRSDLVGDTGVRQIGSQEIQIIDMVKPVTKYAVQVMEPEEICYHMERAYYEATTGRKGPVWLSIPLDVQAAMIEPNQLKRFIPEKEDIKDITKDVKKVVELLKAAERPVILAGNGIQLSNSAQSFYQILELLHIPVLTTWKAIDLLGEDHSLYIGHPGAMGDRGANIILQNADFLLSIGSRIDTSITAFNEPHFGRYAKKVIIDIDEHELRRMNLSQVELKLCCDAKAFIEKLKDEVLCDREILECNNIWERWNIDAHKLRAKYPSVREEHRQVQDVVSCYYFIEVLCENLREDDVVVPESSGAAGEITYQAFALKFGQKMKNAAGLGSMGFGLPYAIGACLANGKRRTILINGDGAFQLNIQELETLHRLQLPVKIFIWSNGGYASIRNMQNSTFDGHQVASGVKSGLTIPDVIKVANAYGYKTYRMRTNTECKEWMPKILEEEEPILCEVIVSEEEGISPRTKTIQREDGALISMELENMWPVIKGEDLDWIQANQ